METILIFAGTTEGRELAECLAKAGIPSVVCVATEYGSRLMPVHEKIRVHEGRMEQREMEALLRRQAFAAVVDATHPFATLVTENIKESAAACGVPYLRLKRSTGEEACTDTVRESAGKEGGWRSGMQGGAEYCYQTAGQCARALKDTEGNILLTTGSKQLSVFCGDEQLRERLYVRVLPGLESLALCREQQIPGNRILALQGPFSVEMNRLFLREYRIRHLVTKESGQNGGFWEKLQAAHEEGAALHIIGNPERTKGQSFGQVCRELERITGKKIQTLPQMEIVLAGAGMGAPAGRTAETEELIRSADVLFGAERLLSELQTRAVRVPYYLAEDILPYLEKLLKEGEKTLQVGILFSGDSGFYSGCKRLYEALAKWQEAMHRAKKARIGLRVLPGISSVSALAAACGVSWQDGEIKSIHGKGDVQKWQAELWESAAYHEKTFLLLSGVEDLKRLGSFLAENGLADCRILYGFRLSYSDQELREVSPEECGEISGEGLYTCLIRNDHPRKKKLTPGRKDGEFLRGRVPMTKEEIRTVAVCKLGLWENAVVYDIGSGTGSVAVEIGERHPSLQVYAIEQKAEAVELIRQNCRRFPAGQIRIIEGEAPEAFAGLPAPTHAFIGGSGGRLRDILSALREKNPQMQVVITAVSLETLAEITEITGQLPVCLEEAVQLQVSRAGKAGAYHLMQAENPVTICRLSFKSEEEEETL